MIQREISPHVGDPSSLLQFAALAVLRDPLLAGETRLDGIADGGGEPLTKQLNVSPRTLRNRVFYEHYDANRVQALEPFFRDIERLKFPDGGGALWFLARRLFGTADDRLNDRVHAEWWPDLSRAGDSRGGFDPIVTCEAGIAWLRTRTGIRSSEGQVGLAPGDRAPFMHAVRALPPLLGGGQGYATLAVDRLATLLRLAWLVDEELGADLLKEVAGIVADHPGGNLALRSLDRCVRATARNSDAETGQSAELTDQSEDGVVGAELSGLASARFVGKISHHAADLMREGHDSAPDLWVPDVYGVRLARVLSHHGDEKDRRHWADWLLQVALNPESADVGTRRASAWALAESAGAPDGKDRWHELERSLSSDDEFCDLFENLDTDTVLGLTELPRVYKSRGGWIDLVTVPMSVHLVPTGHQLKAAPSDADRKLDWIVKDPVASVLFAHLPDSVEDLLKARNHPLSLSGHYQRPSHSDWLHLEEAGVWPWPHAEMRVAEATRDLLREAFTTPSGIRVRTVNEVLDGSGDTVAAISLSVVHAILATLTNENEAVDAPDWLHQRAVHLAALRGSSNALNHGSLSQWSRNQRHSLLDLCATMAARRDLSAFLRGRAAWAVGDLLDLEYPSRSTAELLVLWMLDTENCPEPVRVGAIRALGLLHRRSYLRDLEQVAESDSVRSSSERRMLRWALSWYDL